jgi:5'-AMP-activated protein kinase catalytic alpha subunit
MILDSKKNIKIVDFGLSNLYNKNELLETACGSPCYAAPEMINGEKYSGLKVDIWSSGIVLYAMICGYLPFEDDNNDVLYQKITEGKFTIPGFVSDSARDLLKKILCIDPKKTLRSQRNQKSRLVQFIKPENQHERRSVDQQNYHPDRRRHRRANRGDRKGKIREKHH